MKPVFRILILLVISAFLICYFIPSVKKKDLYIGNSFKNISASLFQPRSWISWDQSVAQAWQRDSASFSFHSDTSRHINTFSFSGRTITITQFDYLLYQVVETEKDHSDSFILSFIPSFDNARMAALENSQVQYARDSRLLYKILPFLEPESFADRSVTHLKSYLENPALFYGMSIDIKQPADTIFLTQQATLAHRQDLFGKIHYLFNQLDSFAVAHKTVPSGPKNLSIHYLPGDSVDVMAGIHINKIIEGDYLVRCRQMPRTQVLATGIYEGPFRDRMKAYAAMDKYFADHTLVKGSVEYEKYLSPLPVADSSIVKIELVYPIKPLVSK